MPDGQFRMAELEMAEDFQESEEVMFRETAGGGERRDWYYGYVVPDEMKRRKEMKGESDPITSSLPVNIPEVRRGWFRYDYVDSDGFGYDREDEMMVPPHEIIDRRVAGKVAFSVCTGNGRTLKGRDLSRVRNAILRMTGFLES